VPEGREKEVIAMMFRVKFENKNEEVVDAAFPSVAAV